MKSLKNLLLGMPILALILFSTTAQANPWEIDQWHTKTATGLPIPGMPADHSLTMAEFRQSDTGCLYTVAEDGIPCIVGTLKPGQAKGAGLIAFEKNVDNTIPSMGHFTIKYNGDLKIRKSNATHLVYYKIMKDANGNRMPYQPLGYTMAPETETISLLDHGGELLVEFYLEESDMALCAVSPTPGCVFFGIGYKAPAAQ